LTKEVLLPTTTIRAKNVRIGNYESVEHVRQI